MNESSQGLPPSLPPEPGRRPGWGGFPGAIVILALLTAAVIVALWFAEPSRFSDRHVEGWALRIFLTAEAVGALGGFAMIARDRNPLWLLAPLIAGVIALLMAGLAIGLGAVGMH